GEPSVRGRKPTSTGRVGLLMSTKLVPSVRPTSAYSLPVCGSVQPQTSLTSVPRSPPRSVMFMKASRSTPSHSKSAALPPLHGVSRPITDAIRSGGLLSTARSVHSPFTRSYTTTEPAPLSSRLIATAATSPATSSAPPNPTRSVPAAASHALTFAVGGHGPCRRHCGAAAHHSALVLSPARRSAGPRQMILTRRTRQPEGATLFLRAFQGLGIDVQYGHRHLFLG